ncbi:MAG: branched-chain amino acid ABC transporter permease [Crenarchaeota archaeon]|nr:branched-chain amino acid ABC transporter permease [Thermoproteota archaeon]
MMHSYVRGLRDSLIVAIGYVPVAIVFGMTARLFGFSSLEAFLTSALIFAGMSQFILISLVNTSFIYAILLASLVNLRHIIYGCVLAERFNIKRKFLIAFGLTDEVFVLSISKDVFDEYYSMGLITGSYASWILGTLAGVLFMRAFRMLGVFQGLEFALVALFIAILVLYVENLNDLLIALYSIIITIVLSFLGLRQVAPLIVVIAVLLICMVFERGDRK